ncbi:hypothetical protein CSB37_02415 [bacterium DOLZORAL124_38_8]|nr:MAG: hypothetical protein CSB37_02415 [bacterium DOLZORAL124_38_8]
MNSTIKALQQSIISGNIPEIIEACFKYALEKKASDIHIEPLKNIVRIRIRIDGELVVIVEYPINIHSGIISKLKIMSNLKIDETRVPQDGRITTFVGETEVDLRVSTLPTPNGEKVVMRIVDKSKKIPTLQSLGFVGRNYNSFLSAIKQPNGIILTSGPTGSGKTTTMYSAMSVLNKPNVNIMTFEDPIENQMEGLNQSQIRSDIGYTFAQGLRTALRQDPDIIMVGEIRDKETIDIAIEASLTGHLVLSTIHTNSAIETVTRILNMGVQDFLLVAAVNLIIAQRLARRLCPKCKQKTTPSKDAQAAIRDAFKIFKPYQGLDPNIFKHPQFYCAKEGGCEHCQNKGYIGRVGLYEVLTMSEGLKKGIMEGVPAFELKKIAQKEGMVSLEQDGLIKVMQGITSIEEIYKLVKN